MTRFATWLELALRIGVLLLFPAVAVLAWRAGGAGRLWRDTGIGIAVILAIAVFVATPAGGNMLVRSYGYGYTVPGSLLFHGVAFGLPMVMTSLIVRALATRFSSAVALYGIGVLVAGMGWILGIVVAVSIFYATR